MAPKSVIGVDLGGTKTLLGLFDEKFHLLEEKKFKTPIADKDDRVFIREFSQAIDHLIIKSQIENLELVGVGVGCAGFVHGEKGVVNSSPNINFLKGYPLGETIAKIAKSNVVIGHDVQVGLYGEHQLGAAVGLSQVIGVFLGTGIGGAIIIDGKLYKGATGYAGEIGHYMMQPLGPLAGSERQGILDNIASRHAIAGEAAALAAKHWAPALFAGVGADVSKINSQTLAESIKNGDKKIKELVASRARTVGIVLANLVNFLSPEMVVLGGGLVEAMPSMILSEVEKGIRDFTLREISRSLKVVQAKLRDHAITTGAAKMVWDRFCQKREKYGMVVA
jgi:glucokinase